MPRSKLWLLVLGALILALVSASQAGMTLDDLAKWLNDGLGGLRRFAAPLLALAALLLWHRQRRWGIGLFALALLVASLSGLPPAPSRP